MKRNISNEHPLRHYFVETLHDCFSTYTNAINDAEIEAYLANMLVDFISVDGLYEIRDSNGRPVESIAEMLQEGDIRFNADSFEREREVHRHVGDFLLFWSGLFPEFLQNLTAPGKPDVFLDPIKQGQFSYYLVSTFDHGSYAHEAPIFKRLSTEFETYRYGLSLVRASFKGFWAQGWNDGFPA